MAWLLMLIPAGGAMLVARQHRPATLAVASTLVAAATLAIGAWAAVIEPTGAWRWGPGMELSLSVEGLARVMVVLVPAIALPVTAFAAVSMADDRGLRRLLALMLAFVAAMLVLVAAADLLTLLIAWELVGVCSWALISHEWRDPSRPAQAAHAFLTTRTADVGLTAAAAVTLAITGTTAYAGVGRLHGWPAQVVAVGLLVAAAAKSGQLPFSPWLFSAMAGPTPVSALLHSATMVAAGAYALARVAPLLVGANWLPDAIIALGLATAIAGGFVATTQTDLKRALAASTSAQYGLTLVAIGAGSTSAAGAHLVTHATFKALLFLCAGVVLHVSGTGDLHGLRLRRVLPVTAVSFAIGAAALAAIPPLGGAWSKEEIVAAAGHRSAWLAIGVIFAGALSAVYAMRLTVLTFGDGARSANRSEPAGVQRGALLALTAATVLLGVLWLPGIGGRFESVTGGRSFTGTSWEQLASLAAIVVALTLVLLADRRGRAVDLALPPVISRLAAGWYGLPLVARRVVVDPVLAVARGLAAFDDRVVDAGVRAAAAVPVLGSRLLAWWGERSIDGTVGAVAGGTLRAGQWSRRADEAVVDGAVEQVARGAGIVGQQSRRLQTGLAHHYYVIAAGGFLALVAVATLGR